MHKIAFFSTSSRPIKSLEELSQNFDICLIVTKTDKLIGRNKEKTPNEIKKFAIKNKIPFFEIDKFSKEVKNELRDILIMKAPDLAVTFDFGYIVPTNLFEIPKHGFINIHFSLLPKYRGASAVQFAILNDETEYGITYHLIDATLDTGDILYQTKYLLNPNFNSEQAYNFLFYKCSQEIFSVLEKYLKGHLTPTPQNHSLATYTYSITKPQHTFIFKEDANIKEVTDERKFFRQIKAFNPWPKPQIKASTLLNIPQFSNYSLKNADNDPLLKINDANFTHNHLEITELTIVNGKTLQIQEFISGYLKKK